MATLVSVMRLIACWLLLWTLSVHAVASGAFRRQAPCKAVYSSTSWPSEQIWSSFNQSIGGVLLTPTPMAVVCDPSKPQYSQQHCSSLTASWTSPDTHAADPVSVMSSNFQDDQCTPFVQPCQTTAFPHYVVDATNADVVAKTIKFASQNNVRLTVKNTGHDYLGRSTSRGLSLWTHRLGGVTFRPFFTPRGGRGFVAAVTCGPAARFRDIYRAAAARSVVVVGGGDPSVGLGGWLTGGGHSPLSPRYGLGADNTLEMQVVTPSGDIVIANPYQNKDLFWALNGGGGSTFGVITSITVKTHPTIYASIFQLEIESTTAEAQNNNNENFFNALADIHGSFEAYSDAYGGGFVTWGSAAHINSTMNGQIPPLTDPSKGLVTRKPMTIMWTGFIQGGNAEGVYNNIIGSLHNKIHSTAGLTSSIRVAHRQSASFVLRYLSGLKSSGTNRLMGSRLFPKEALSNRAGLLQYFRRTEGLFSQALLTSGPAVRSGDVSTLSATPAWRTAYAHMIVTQSWQWKSASQQSFVANQITNNYTQALRQLAPNSGAYVNEADRNEPNYQQAFWGSNYARLQQIKTQYDPNGVFFCSFCVGSESWQEMADGSVCPR